MTLRVLLGLGALSAVACAHRVPPLDPGWKVEQVELRGHAESLRETVQALVDARVNLQRLTAAERRARQFSLAVKREPIDWFSLQDNLVMELPGKSRRLIYLVAHVDKTDMNPLKLASMMLNGVLDEPIGFSYLSEGALDNASGVAVVLEAARVLSGRERSHTVRVLLTGSEEAGLRGARAHVARIPNDEWPLIDAVINVDSVGKRGERTCVVNNESDARLMARAVALAAQANVPLGAQPMPALGGGDHAAFASTSFFHELGRGLLFNFVGGLLPQRSWFTGFHHAPVVTFLSCNLVDAGDWAASFVGLPLGQLHGPRDNASVLDPVVLTEAFQVVEALSLELSGAAPLPSTDR